MVSNFSDGVGKSSSNLEEEKEVKMFDYKEPVKANSFEKVSAHEQVEQWQNQEIKI